MSVNHSTLDFPDSVSFHLALTSQRPIDTIDLEFGTNHVFSCATTSYWSARTEPQPDDETTVTWEWDMRQSGSMPPGAAIWWRWRITDESGQEFVTQRKEVDFGDSRFDWLSYTDGNVTFHWYAGGDDFGRRLSDAAQTGLRTLQLGRELVAPVTVFVYESSEELRGAVLFAQGWTGGLAFVHHNILLVSADPLNFERGLPVLIHELAHLLVEEVTFNCFGGLPTWLDEGLAVYAEGVLPASQQTALDEAVAADALISLRSLSSSFPAGHSGAILSYAQSYSLVAYLLDTYGWGRMQELLAIFAQGSTEESALRQAYALDYDELESAWRVSLGLPAR